MADEKKTGGIISNEDFLGWIVGLLFFAVIAGAAILAIQDRIASLQQENSGELAVGDVVITVGTTNVWDSPGGDRFLGVQKFGAVGTIIDGPALVEGISWWDVDFRERPDGWVSGEDIVARPSFIGRFLAFFKSTGLFISLIISFLLLTGIIYFVLRINQIRKEERRALNVPKEDAFGESPVVNEKWMHVLDLIESENPNDWRQAILEADIMLDELVSSMGYHGETLGEKMKGVEQSDFTTINEAWEAHKVRNRIAHDGRDFILTGREARRVIDLYRQVFEEFHYI